MQTESVDYYERAAIDAANVDDWPNLAIAQAKIGRYESAIASYDRALAINPDDPQTLTNRGNALRYTGRYDEVIASYNLIISLKPTYQPVYYHKAAV